MGKKRKSELSKKLTNRVKLYPDIHKRLKIVMANTGIPMQQLANEAIDLYLKQYE